MKFWSIGMLSKRLVQSFWSIVCSSLNCRTSGITFLGNLCFPHPDKTTRSVAFIGEVGSAIGWMRFVKVISSAVRIKAMSFMSCWRLNCLCGMIVSNSTVTPPLVWRYAPTSAYTFDGSALSRWQQWAAVNINRLLKIDAPQKCASITFLRSETGNWRKKN